MSHHGSKGSRIGATKVSPGCSTSSSVNVHGPNKTNHEQMGREYHPVNPRCISTAAPPAEWWRRKPPLMPPTLGLLPIPPALDCHTRHHGPC